MGSSLLASTAAARWHAGKEPVDQRVGRISRCQTHPRATRVLLDTLAGLGYVRLADGRYELTDEGRKWLPRLQDSLLYRYLEWDWIARLDGFVRTIREDGKIDLSLNPSGYQRIAPLTKRILETIKANGGRLDLDDQSSPEAIRAVFGVSKKAFKQALGALFRQRRIQFLERGIEMVEEDVFRPGRKK